MEIGLKNNLKLDLDMKEVEEIINNELIKNLGEIKTLIKIKYYGQYVDYINLFCNYFYFYYLANIRK